jgi:ATP-dependent DNA helicase DinG
MFETSVLNAIGKLASWADRTDSGDGSDITFPFEKKAWDFVCCEPGNCLGPKCAEFRNCFYWRARAQWEDADIIVANHALFFTNLKMLMEEDGDFSLLPSYGAVVFDEAHAMENDAAKYLGLHMTKTGFDFFIRKLYDPNTGRGFLLKGIPNEIELRELVSKIISLASSFFGNLSGLLATQKTDTFRMMKPGTIQDVVSEDLSALVAGIKKIKEANSDEDYCQELMSYAMKLEYYVNAFDGFSNMKFEDHVYWIEKQRGNTEKIELFAAPLNVKDILKNNIFNGDIPVILVGATLSINHSLEYFRGRTGYDNGNELILDTVFDHKGQMKLYISKMVPHPEEEKYSETLCSEIKKYIELTHGKAFVLFTSYELLRECASHLKDFFVGKGIRLLVQGEELNRTKMLREFRTDIDSVIFGASSFWTGVDVPGTALSNVIITKLPFLVPSHPLIAARSDLIEGEGKNSFLLYHVPEAVLRLKQGVGRLIRSKTDSGIVVILDRRILTKSYGKIFLNALPECEIKIIPEK